jgi:hypothetical protein
MEMKMEMKISLAEPEAADALRLAERVREPMHNKRT